MKLLSVLFLLTIMIFSYSCNNQDTKKNNNKQSTSQDQNTQSVDKERSEAEIAFKINGRPYYKNDIKYTNINSAVQDAVLYEAALLEGKNKDPEYIKLIERYKRNILLGRYKGEIIKSYLSTQEITEEDMKKYYADNIIRFTQLDLIKISTQDKETSDKIHNQLSSGLTPDEIKSKYDNVTVYKMDQVRKYNSDFNKLEKSEITKPILENKFYNIYVITDVYTKDFEKFKRSVKNQLTNKLKQDALRQHADKMKKDKNITVEIAGK